jgi:hypothetical protein
VDRHLEGPVDVGVLDEAFAAMAAYGPEFGPGLSNHGPMAAEALVRLGQGAEVGPFLERYAARLTPAPVSGRPLADDRWEGALGDLGSYPDWEATFAGELAERPPAEVLATWVPRLAPGTIAAAGHGLLRTAHGTRALADPGADTSPGSPRVAELARGLAYWAARYQELPGPPLLVGRSSIPEALAGLPGLPEESPAEGLITDQVRHLDMIDTPFEQAVAALGAPDDLTAGLDALAIGGAGALLANAEGGDVVALVHAVTVPMAIDLLLTSVPAADRPTVFAYGWQAVAALHAVYAADRPGPGDRPSAGPGREEGDPGALIEAAVASGDEHAIKLTEAVVRAHRRTGAPELFAAAARFTGAAVP